MKRKLAIAGTGMAVAFGVAVAISVAISLAASVAAPFEPSPEQRALAFLAREVPRWSRENQCFSCHNNGDAARALFTAAQLGYPIAAETLADTSDFLAKPDRWDHNGAEDVFSDKRLARLQFAAALVIGIRAGQVKDRPALCQAAQLVADEQAEDGSWQIDAAGTIGSPVTYGQPLATVVAIETLRAADSVRFRNQIDKAKRWLGAMPVHNILQASAVLLACDSSQNPDRIAQRQRSLDLLRIGQSQDGGWGSYENAPPEIFDTAVVLLALAPLMDQPEIRSMVERGRKFLLANQSSDGSWPETTRPPGATSYAQRLSTTGWATLALLGSRDSALQRRVQME